MKNNTTYYLSEKVHRRLSILLKKIKKVSKLCSLHNFNRQNFYNIKSNKVEINLDTFLHLAYLLGTSPVELLKFCLSEEEIILNNSLNFYYKVDYIKLKSIYFEKRRELREYGKTLNYILNKKSKEGLIFEQRQIENILSGKKCSLKAFLYVCELLELNPIETISNCMEV